MPCTDSMQGIIDRHPLCNEIPSLDNLSQISTNLAVTAADETVSGDLERLSSVPKSRSRLMKVDNSGHSGHRPVPTVLLGGVSWVGSLELRL